LLPDGLYPADAQTAAVPVGAAGRPPYRWLLPARWLLLAVAALLLVLGAVSLVRFAFG
jgi:hypothetical protein